MKKLKLKYGSLTVECGEVTWWAWGMLLCAGIVFALGGGYLSGVI